MRKRTKIGGTTMNINKVKDVLFSTKNYNKILSSFNALSLKEKQKLLKEEIVIKRINKIANTSLLVSILIDLPYEFRTFFIRNLNDGLFRSDLDQCILEFLKLPNYHDWDILNLPLLQELKDQKTIVLIIRKLSNSQLEDLINTNYNQSITEAAFCEYSKRHDDLFLDKHIINILDDATLCAELKRRKKKNFSIHFDLNYFLSLKSNKQNCILLYNDLTDINDGLINILEKKYEAKDPEYLTKRFKDLLIDFNYPKLIELQIIISKLDDNLAYSAIQTFFTTILKFKNPVLDKYAFNLIYRFRQLGKQTKELWHLSKAKPFAIINYLNTGIIDNDINKTLDNTVTIEQYQKINQKQINNINKILNVLYHDSPNFSSSICLSYAHKLYLIFGYENTWDLLNKKFGFLDFQTLSNLLDDCNVKDIEFIQTNKTYEPKIKSDFINFFIGDKKDNNTTIKRMLRGELEIIQKNFANIFNNLERYQAQLGNKIHLNKLMAFLEGNGFAMLPNEYKLTKDIITTTIKSFHKTNPNDQQNHANYDTRYDKNYFEQICQFYHLYLESRIKSSIPRVMGKTDNNYTYEVIKLDDPIIMTLGYQTGCCFRLSGASKEFLRYCSENPHGRVIVIRNPHEEICSMVPIIRNGNIIAGNSIESNSKGNDFYIYAALKKCYEDIISLSKQSEDHPIIAGLVTNLHSRCYSKRRFKKNIFPIRDEEFYTNYEGETYIVYGDDTMKESDFISYTPEAIYYDERPEVIIYHWHIEDRENVQKIAEQRMKSIIYNIDKNNKKYPHLPRYLVCSEDWFLGIDFNSIYGECLPKDPRAIIEYNAVKTYFEEKMKENENINIVNDSAFSKEQIDSLIAKKLTY